MLRIAKVHEAELVKKFDEMSNLPKLRYAFPVFLEFPAVQDNDWNNIIRVSMNSSGEVLGYLNAHVSRSANKISNLTLVGFSESLSDKKIFELDLLEFLKFLLTEFYKVTWSVCARNPVKNSYDKLITALKGRVVGTFKDEFLIFGEREDEVWYELISKQSLPYLDEIIEARKVRLQNGKK